MANKDQKHERKKDHHKHGRQTEVKAVASVVTEPEPESVKAKATNYTAGRLAKRPWAHLVIKREGTHDNQANASARKKFRRTQARPRA